MSAPYGYRRAQVLAALETYGPMTMAEVCATTGLDKFNTAAILTGMGKPTKRLPKRVYIAKYVYDAEGMRRYPRAVFAVGDKDDASKPRRNTKAVQKRYRDAKKSRMRTNFVFNLGLEVRV